MSYTPTEGREAERGSSLCGHWEEMWLNTPHASTHGSLGDICTSTSVRTTKD